MHAGRCDLGALVNCRHADAQVLERRLELLAQLRPVDDEMALPLKAVEQLDLKEQANDCTSGVASSVFFSRHHIRGSLMIENYYRRGARRCGVGRKYYL